MSSSEDEAAFGRDEFVKIVGEIAATLGSDPDIWENTTVHDYLSAMAAWVEDMDGYFENLGDPVPTHPTWELFAQILQAARVYE